MTPFTLPVSCVHCAGRLDLVNATTQGLLSIAVVECEPCDRQFELTIRIQPHQDPERHRATNRRSMNRARAAARTPDTANV